MIVKPRTHEWYRRGKIVDEIVTIPSSDGVFIECEAYSPKSAIGKTVHVYFPPEVVTEALKLFRDAARDMRQTPINADREERR